MNDDEFVAALQKIFDGDGPSTVLDRSDGYGEDYRITSLRVVASKDGFDDLEVTVDVGGKPVLSWLLFDREWREASDLADPEAYAAYVLARWKGRQAPDASAAHAPQALGPDDSWSALLEALRRGCDGVAEVDGGIRAIDDDGEVVVRVTPQEWAMFAAGRPDPFGELDELIGSRWDDEHHIVFFRGDFHRSIRAQLPPVRSLLLREPSARLDGGRWTAADEDLGGGSR